MKTGITLLTMSAGNVLVLRKTLESFCHVCDEVIYGDLLLFESDREIVRSYEKEFNLKIIPFKFNALFTNGFSYVLNILASRATNDMVLYMNTSEVIEEDYGVVDIVKGNPECNTFFFVHRTDPHRWHRLHNRNELQWSGRIHEQLKGEYRPYHKPVFCMKDLPKDNFDYRKAQALDTLKEAVYFEQYIQIVNHPELLGETDPGWLAFAQKDYDSFKERLSAMGRIYEALQLGNFERFMYAINSQENKDFKSSIAVEFQNDPKFLNK